MKLHGNARLSVKGRELLIDRVEKAGWSLSSAAALPALLRPPHSAVDSGVRGALAIVGPRPDSFTRRRSGPARHRRR
jgi:hypothetical protein